MSLSRLPATLRPVRVCRQKAIGRIQAFRVQALACVFGQRQPKGWTLNACMPRQSLFSDRLAGVALQFALRRSIEPDLANRSTHRGSLRFFAIFAVSVLFFNAKNAKNAQRKRKGLRLQSICHLAPLVITNISSAAFRSASSDARASAQALIDIPTCSANL